MTDAVPVRVRETPSLTVVDLYGSLTVASRDPMLEAHREAAGLPAKVILLNFSGVTYINSGGISAVVAFLIETRRAGEYLLVTGLTPHYRKVFQMMGLSQHARLVDSEEDARAFAAAHPAPAAHAG